MTDFAFGGGAAARAGSANPAAPKSPPRIASRLDKPLTMLMFFTHYSMPVQELRAVDQSPGEVHQGIPALHAAGLRIRRHDLLPLWCRKTRKNHQVHSGHQPLRILCAPHVVLKSRARLYLPLD